MRSPETFHSQFPDPAASLHLGDQVTIVQSPMAYGNHFLGFEHLKICIMNSTCLCVLS